MAHTLGTLYTHFNVEISPNIIIVFGFFQDSFTGVEQEQGHTVQAGWQKGAAEAGVNLIFNVVNTPGTASEFTASYFYLVHQELFTPLTGEGAGFDYTVSTTTVRALFRRPTPPDDVLFIFRMDAIAQGDDETLALELVPLTTLPTGSGVYFRNTLSMTIVDSDGKIAIIMIPSVKTTNITFVLHRG